MCGRLARAARGRPIPRNSLRNTADLLRGTHRCSEATRPVSPLTSTSFPPLQGKVGGSSPQRPPNNVMSRVILPIAASVLRGSFVRLRVENRLLLGGREGRAGQR